MRRECVAGGARWGDVDASMMWFVWITRARLGGPVDGHIRMGKQYEEHLAKGDCFPPFSTSVVIILRFGTRDD